MNDILDRIIALLPPQVHDLMGQYGIDNSIFLAIVFFGILIVFGILSRILRLAFGKSAKRPNFSDMSFYQDLERLHELHTHELSTTSKDAPQYALRTAQVAYIEHMRHDPLNAHEDELDRRNEYLDLLAEVKISKKIYNKMAAALGHVDISKAQSVLLDVLPRLTDPKQKAFGFYILGCMGTSKADFETALSQFDAALNIEPQNLLFMKRAGFCAMNAGLSDKALAYYTKRLNESVRVDGKNSAAHASALFDIGGVYEKFEEFAKAEPYFAQAVDAGSIAFGKSSSEVGTYLRSLTVALYGQEKFVEAEASYRAAMEINSAGLSKRDPQYVFYLEELLAIVRAQGKNDEVEALEKQIDRLS
ncbi:MAG: hypothetical protein ACWA40_00675 [Planktomarina sp.]